MHDRLGDDIDMESCRSLFESMEKHGQKQRVLGRLVPGDPDYEVELIFGARRLFIAQQMGAELLVELREIDDRDALIEMDIENRVRMDISPYERGLSYRRWLKGGYFSSQAEIAKCLGVSEAQVSRLLRYSELPAAIIGAFSSACDIREEWAVALAKRCRDEEFRPGLLSRARNCADVERQLSPQHVYDVLISDGSRRPVPAESRDAVVKNEAGEPILRVAFRAKTVHFIVPREWVTKTSLQGVNEFFVGYFGERPAQSLEAGEMQRPAASNVRSLSAVRGKGAWAAREILS
jgi:ParB family transcriptional regulator, chromosome partitioning protein